MTQNVEALTQRVEKLEKQNRRLRRTAWSAIIIATTTLLLPYIGVALSRATNIYPVFRARTIIIHDSDGRERSFLGMPSLTDESNPMLTLMNADGVPEVMLGANEHGGMLSISDYSSGSDVALGITDSGPSFQIWDAESNLVLVLSADDDRFNFGVVDRGDKNTVTLSLATTSPALMVSDKDKKILFSAP